MRTLIASHASRSTLHEHASWRRITLTLHAPHRQNQPKRAALSLFALYLDPSLVSFHNALALIQPDEPK